jgi:uncharacterized lipoprotein
MEGQVQISRVLWLTDMGRGMSAGLRISPTVMPCYTGIFMKRLMGVAVSAALMLGGCALTEDVVPIPYKARGGAQVGDGLPVTVVASDARTTDRTRISNKVNGYGMEMAAIRATRNIEDIVREAFEEELRARGFRVAAGGPAASLSIVRFYSHFESGIFSAESVADVQMHVSVRGANGAQLFDKDVNVTGKETGIQIASGSNAAASLSDGMGRAFEALFSDPAFVTAIKTHAVSTAGNS